MKHRDLTIKAAFTAALVLFLASSGHSADSYGDSKIAEDTTSLPVAVSTPMVVPQPSPAPASETEPFYGLHQGGILTPQQDYTCFAVFDLTAKNRKEVQTLLKTWTEASARMSVGQPAADIETEPQKSATDSGDSLDVSPSHLTLTFGFGPGLFTKAGKDRYGLAARRPKALIDLPKFPGDQLQEQRTGGDLSVQACSNDPQVALHAIRELSRLAEGVAELRWEQNGFVPKTKPGQTGRNLMGFKDGTMNPPTTDKAAMNHFVWVDQEGPTWMKGGSYMVVRPIRIALEHWDKMKVAFQEQTVGRQKYSGAPLGQKGEHEALDLGAKDADGNPVIPENSHARLAAPAENNGMQILRRAYSYDNNLALTAERWPPWHQGMEMDAGLLFQCYQKDPNRGFVPLFEKMSRFDMMNQFLTHVGSGIFAIPPGAKPGNYIGQELFD